MHYRIIITLLVPALLAAEPKEVHIPSTADGKPQPAIFLAPASPLPQPVPLVVALHSWSSNYKQTLNKPVQDFCTRNGWAYIHPDFRGPNRNPAATGSELAVQDVLDAVAYAKANAKVDPTRVYLTGTSGGGYMSLLMAGRSPGTFAAVSAWVPISDLAAWHRDSTARRNKYAREIVQSCGGKPGASPEADLQYHLRSPVNWLHLARGVPIDIYAGIRDGHTGSVPVDHALRAFNVLARPVDRLTRDEINHFVQKATVPAHLPTAAPEPAFEKKQPLFIRSSGPARITLFNGGHEMVPSALIQWLENKKI